VPVNIFTGFKHETNTFSQLPMDLSACQSRELHYAHVRRPVYPLDLA